MIRFISRFGCVRAARTAGLLATLLLATPVCAQFGMSLDEFDRKAPAAKGKKEGYALWPAEETRTLDWQDGTIPQWSPGMVFTLTIGVAQGTQRIPPHIRLEPRNCQIVAGFKDQKLCCLELRAEKFPTEPEVRTLLDFVSEKKKWTRPSWAADVYPLVVNVRVQVIEPGGMQLARGWREYLEITETDSRGTTKSTVPLREWGYYRYVRPQAYLEKTGVVRLILQRADGRAYATYELFAQVGAGCIAYARDIWAADAQTFWLRELDQLADLCEAKSGSRWFGYEGELARRVGDPAGLRLLNERRFCEAVTAALENLHTPPDVVRQTLQRRSDARDALQQTLLPSLHRLLQRRAVHDTARARAAQLLGEFRRHESIEPLIKVLASAELQDARSQRGPAKELKERVVGALETITGEQLADDVLKWKQWLKEHH